MFIKQNLYWIELNWIKPKSFCFTLCGSIKNVRWVFGHYFCFVFIFVRVIVSSLHFYFELLPDGDAVTDSLARAYVCFVSMHGKFSKSKYFLVFISLEEKHQISTDTHNNSQAQSTNAFREWSMGKNISNASDIYSLFGFACSANSEWMKFIYSEKSPITATDLPNFVRWFTYFFLR